MSGSVPKLGTGDPKVDPALDQLRRVINELAGEPLVSGVLREGISINNTTDTRVAHGLKRKPRGWVVVRSTVTGAIYETGAGTDILTIRGTADGVASLYIF